jgi:CheY-like chemotaxis protein
MQHPPVMGGTVLVVDDDDDVRSLYRQVLIARGYRVIEAATLDEAFVMLLSKPAAIVLDLDLPDGKGTALLDALVRNADAPPVVLCTASVYGARVGRRYHIAALSKFALSAIGDEVDRVVGSGKRPRRSRTSIPESRPSLA